MNEVLPQTKKMYEYEKHRRFCQDCGNYNTPACEYCEWSGKEWEKPTNFRRYE